MTLVVRRRRPFVVVGLVLMAGLVSWGASWWVLSQDRQRLAGEAMELRTERDALLQARDLLKEERQLLAGQVAVLERTRQVESEAYARVDRQLADLQDQLLDLKEEVTFYKEIVSDDRASASVRIQRLVIEPDGAAQEYKFRLVLTRSIRNDKVASGVVELAVDGEQDGERLRLGLDELGAFPVGPLAFSFKHFERLEGRLHLPPRFVPKRVIVRVSAERNGARPLRETFPWPSTNS
jgi:hypothetical protein